MINALTMIQNVAEKEGNSVAIKIMTDRSDRDTISIDEIDPSAPVNHTLILIINIFITYLISYNYYSISFTTIQNT